MRAMSGSMPLVRLLVHPWCAPDGANRKAVYGHFRMWCGGGDTIPTPLVCSGGVVRQWWINQV